MLDFEQSNEAKMKKLYQSAARRKAKDKKEAISTEKLDELEICDREFDTDNVDSHCVGLLDLEEKNSSGSKDRDGKIPEEAAPVGKRTQLSKSWQRRFQRKSCGNPPWTMFQ